ncbi:YcaO-like family protein [Bradyrhizobium lablabi]|uniref:YcaO-like family protein n=1 Tax=Bradyrhizobium lablabi TaxID=722472 RepID=UPI001BA4764E|nr:YcaO-like family protein [Bradyrhizobium lablabi]MBR1121181.1 YcaO-like family protein [Bradyrhizobium lablabi]
MDERTYEYWLGPKEMKYSASGVERAVKPEATIRRAEAVLDVIGVTKVADVTDLDRVGIPNFMSVRPHDLGPGISYYNGKGTTRAAAHAGALMEAVERHAGERYDGRVIASSYHNLRDEYPCIDPLEIHVPMIRKYSEHLMLEWVLGYDLMTRRPTLAPLNCVVSPYTPDSGMALFYSSTNGLASGNSRVDAISHALCEVIERDATSLAMARSDVKPAVASLLAEMGFASRLPTEAEEAPLISLRGLPRTATALVRKLQGAGLDVELLNLTSDVGIATIACTITDPQGPPGGMNAFSGCGTHPDARIALTRALTEAAQSRLSCIQGGRENLPDYAPARGARPVKPRPRNRRTIRFEEIASHQHASVNDDVEFMIERMRHCGFEQVVVVDVTSKDVGIPVVRVIVPRSEMWTLYVAEGARASLGPRALRQIR